MAKLIGHSEAATDLGEPELRPASGSGSHATLAGSAVGTPAFMSPEQARGDLEHLGTASDVYSLGATLYCLLTGRAPFANRRDALQLVKRGDFPPPRALDARIPKPLETVCLKAMALQPEDRYASVGEMVADLERWMADEPVSVHRETASERVARWMRRHRAWVQAGGAALIAVAAVSLAAAVLIARAWRSSSSASRRRGKLAKRWLKPC